MLDYTRLLKNTGGLNPLLNEEELYRIPISSTRERKWLYLPMNIYRSLRFLRYYLNYNTNGVTPTNDKDEKYELKYKVTRIESVDSF